MWQAKVRRSDSRTWAVMLSGAKSLDLISRWQVGKGTDISILEHKWMLDRIINKWPTEVDNNFLENRMVRELIGEDGNWDHGILRRHFGEDLVKIILDCNINTRGEDVLELSHPLSGKTITAMAFEEQFKSEVKRDQWFRRIKIKPREVIFWWRIQMKAIPTAEWLWIRGLKLDSKCPWGCEAVENIEHITKECRILQATVAKYWSWGFKVSIPDVLNEDYIVKVRRDQGGITLLQIYCSTVYYCWKARNGFVHGKEYGTPTIIANMVLGSLSRRHVNLLQEHWDISRSLRPFSNNIWFPPPPGWLKVNVDGALNEANAGGLGIIIRNGDGEMIKAAGFKIIHWDIGIVELKAVEAIKRVTEEWMFDILGVIIESDNANVIKMLMRMGHQEGWKEEWKEGSPFCTNMFFMQEFRQVLFSWVGRSGNMAADFCARHATTEEFIWARDCCNNASLLYILDRDRSLYAHIVKAG